MSGTDRRKADEPEGRPVEILYIFGVQPVTWRTVFLDERVYYEVSSLYRGAYGEYGVGEEDGYLTPANHRLWSTGESGSMAGEAAKERKGTHLQRRRRLKRRAGRYCAIYATSKDM
jgi:hypothetical protein